MIEIFDKQRRRVAIAENAHAISEQERINAIFSIDLIVQGFIQSRGDKTV